MVPAVEPPGGSIICLFLRRASFNCIRCKNDGLVVVVVVARINQSINQLIQVTNRRTQHCCCYTTHHPQPNIDRGIATSRTIERCQSHAVNTVRKRIQEMPPPSPERLYGCRRVESSQSMMMPNWRRRRRRKKTERKRELLEEEEKKKMHQHKKVRETCISVIVQTGGVRI